MANLYVMGWNGARKAPSIYFLKRVATDELQAWALIEDLRDRYSNLAITDDLMTVLWSNGPHSSEEDVWRQAQ